MFTKQNTKQKVYKTKLNFTNTLCLQNKIQNINFGQVMFTKQNKCLQNKCVQNKNLGQIMYAKQNTKQKV